MNAFADAHFSSVPRLHHQRSVFDRSCTHKLTFNAGDVIPILCEEILPGDTVSLSTSKLVRLQTLLTPVMDNVYLDTYYFYTPNRILWDHWKNFLGENTDSSWIPQVEYTVPKLGSPSGGFATGTIADYFGYPVGITWSADDAGAPSALPLRAYAMITNEFFRDQNISSPNLIDFGDNNIQGSNSNGISYYYRGGVPFRASKYHDYFTSCLPAPQKGPDVNIAGNANLRIPVMTGAQHSVATLPNPAPSAASSIPATYTLQTGIYREGQPTNYFPTRTTFNDGSNIIMRDGIPTYTSQSQDNLVPNNLWAVADSSAGIDPGISISVNSLRIAVLTQMYYEALARAGSRYEEQIEQFFGVTNPDARVNHPEYLGGNRIRINVREVTNTAQTEADFLGDLGGQSSTADTHFDFVKSFTEHGWLIGLCVLRYDHSYSQGMPAKFTRTSKFDFYNPLFAQIGEQPVYDREIYATSTSIANPTVFGYQEAWASYRYGENRSSGYMRPQVEGSYGHWTLTDNYATKPNLSPTWLKETPTNLDRALAVTSTVSHQAFADFYFEMKWTRPMPMYSVPGAIGAF